MRIATLSLTIDNKAKFMIVREISLGRLSDASKSQAGSRHSRHATRRTSPPPPPPSPPLNWSSPLCRLRHPHKWPAPDRGRELGQTLQSSVFLLTSDGQLMVVFMIDRSSTKLASISRPPRSRRVLGKPPAGSSGLSASFKCRPVDILARASWPAGRLAWCWPQLQAPCRWPKYGL